MTRPTKPAGNVPFPVDTLPRSMRDLVEAIGAAVQVAPEVAALPALAVAASKHSLRSAWPYGSSVLAASNV